jgi:hypothetical protein
MHLQIKINGNKKTLALCNNARFAAASGADRFRPILQWRADGDAR